MFDFSWSELALILAVSIVLLRPKDVPAMMRTMGKALRKIRSLAHEFQAHFDEMVKDTELKDVARQFKEIQSINIGSAIMRVVDRDGHLQQSLSETSVANRQMFRPVKVHDSQVLSTEYNARVMTQQSEAPPPSVSDMESDNYSEQDKTFPYRQELASVPVIIPVGPALRTLRERANPCPAILPPHSIRPWGLD